MCISITLTLNLEENFVHGNMGDHVSMLKEELKNMGLCLKSHLLIE